MFIKVCSLNFESDPITTSEPSDLADISIKVEVDDSRSDNIEDLTDASSNTNQLIEASGELERRFQRELNNYRCNAGSGDIYDRKGKRNKPNQFNNRKLHYSNQLEKWAQWSLDNGCQRHSCVSQVKLKVQNEDPKVTFRTEIEAPHRKARSEFGNDIAVTVIHDFANSSPHQMAMWGQGMNVNTRWSPETTHMGAAFQHRGDQTRVLILFSSHSDFTENSKSTTPLCD